jgi:hypothetical protein
MIIIELFLIDFHCRTKLLKKKGGESENFHIFEAPGLHFWGFLKGIHKRIGSKLTVFYKNDYHFT